MNYPDCSDETFGCTHRAPGATAPDGTPCSSQTVPGWYLTSFGVVRCCHRGGAYGVYCQNPNVPSECPADANFFEGRCLRQKCPEGYLRSEFCACTPVVNA